MSSFLVFTSFLLTFSVYVNSKSCDYATFLVQTLYPSLNIGTFSLSTNRCQSLKAQFKLKVDILGLVVNLPFDGSLRLQCHQYNKTYSQIAVNLYDNPLCNDLNLAVDEPIYLDMDNNNKFTIYNSIQFSLEEMNCDSMTTSTTDKSSCGISMEMANNCSWSASERYINITVPDSKCVSLAADFKGILSVLPFQILPQELVNNMETTAMEFQCCSSDNSLLINNYSDTTCSKSPDSQFRINEMYNGQCFVIGNNEDIIKNDKFRPLHYDDENEKDTYVYIMKWQCNTFQSDCDQKGIPIIDDTMLPIKCTNYCIEKGKTQHPTSEPTKDPTIDPTSDPSQYPTSDATRAPTSDPIANKGESGNGDNNDKENIHIGQVAVIIGIIALFVIIIVSSVLYGRRKAMQRAVEGTIAQNINKNDGKSKKFVKGDDKYEAFVSELDEDINVVQIQDGNQMDTNTTIP